VCRALNLTSYKLTIARHLLKRFRNYLMVKHHTIVYVAILLLLDSFGVINNSVLSSVVLLLMLSFISHFCFFEGSSIILLCLIKTSGSSLESPARDLWTGVS
jgi:hypothetical protein